ncbi:hypothetical protein PSENEW3_00001051 [Picochlorum sp. SENEW3]|nr:hypothetical protein PSENEW3_00001051 [Picochlorum sp. SENEW3]
MRQIDNVPTNPRVKCLSAFVLVAQIIAASGSMLDISAHHQRTILENKATDSNECFKDGYLQNVDAEGNLLFRMVKLPSAIACLERVTLDTAMTVQMVTSMKDLFNANYAFYDYARDAPDSSPLNNPLDWAIYNGSSGGQVDFSSEFGKLIERVERDGANLFTTLEMCDIIAKARDSHTGNPLTFVNNGVLDSIGLELLDMGEFDKLKQNSSISLPKRYLNLEEVDGSVSLILLYPASGKKEEIKSIDGVAAVDFMDTLVSNTALQLVSSYKARGARMQQFLKNVRGIPPYLFQEYVAYDFRNLPECMNVEFASGSTTQWCFALFVPGKLANQTVEDIINNANTIPEDGPYEIFQEAVNEALGSRLVSDFPLEDPGPTDNQPSSTGSRQSEEEVPNPLNWKYFRTTDQEIIDDYGDDILFAITSVDDATVLKFNAFKLDNVTTIAEFCKEFYDFGEQMGSTKLIVDLTDNGGGATTQAYAMTQCLYPTITFKQLSIPYTKRFSKVVQLNQNLLEAGDDVLDALDTFDVSNVLNADINATIEMLKTVRHIHKGLVVLSTGYSNQMEYKRDVTTISLMLEEIMRERHVRSSFVPLLLQLMRNTWLETVQTSNSPASFGSASFKTVIQGGKSVKIATNFARLNPEDYVTFQAAMDGRTPPFQSYVLTGNGLGGSSSALFEFGTLQYSYLNPDATPAISVSYGCSGNKETCPINQYQGGSVSKSSNQNMKMYFAVGKGLALGDLVATLLKIDDSNPEISSIGEEYISALNEYSLSVPTPPMTATSAYTGFQFAFLSAMSKIAGYDSIPAEYFDVPPKEYIPYWPAWYTVDNPYATDALLPVYKAIANGSY